MERYNAWTWVDNVLMIGLGVVLVVFLVALTGCSDDDTTSTVTMTGVQKPITLAPTSSEPGCEHGKAKKCEDKP